MDFPEKPLVTIEVRDGALRQVKGRFNRKATDGEMEAVNTWFTDVFRGAGSQPETDTGRSRENSTFPFCINHTGGEL